MQQLRISIATIVCIAIVAGTVVVPQRTQAIPVTVAADPWTVFQTIKVEFGNALSKVGSAAASALQIKEFTLDGAASVVLNQVRTSLVRSVLDWAKGGFNGRPAFVQNLDKYLTEVADQTVHNFITGSELGSLCSPFALQVRGALSVNYKARMRSGGSTIERCSFDSVGKNIKDFGKSVDRAKQMTFADFFTYASNPVNSPQGAYLDAEAKLRVAITNKKGERLKELDFGKGFLSKKECLPEAPDVCWITTPGETISASINKSLGLGADALVTADEINEFVSSVITNTMQAALTGGLSGYNPSAYSGSVGYAQNDITYTSSIGPLIARILPAQKRAEDQFVSIYTAIENQCYIVPNPVDDEGEPVVWTDQQYADDRIQQFKSRGVYDLRLDAIAKAEDARKGYNELLALQQRANAARTGAENVDVSQAFSNLTDQSYIYMDNQNSDAYTQNAETQIFQKCGSFDNFGGGGG